MRRRKLKILLRAIAICALMVFFIGLYLQKTARFSKASDPGEFRTAGLAMQLARTAKEAGKIMPEPSDRLEMARLQRIDFIFITIYWLLYALMSVLLTQRRLRLALPLGVAALLCTTLVAWFDIREDLAILAVIRAAPNLTDAMVSLIRHYSEMKWTLCFGLIILLSFIFVPRRDFETWTGKLSALAGLCFIAASLIGLTSLHYLPVASGVLIPGSFLTIILFLFAADGVADSRTFRSDAR